MINQALGCFIGSLMSIALVCAGLDGRDRRIGVIICLVAAAGFGLEATLLT